MTSLGKMNNSSNISKFIDNCRFSTSSTYSIKSDYFLMPHKGEKNFQMQFSCIYRLNVEETKFSFNFSSKILTISIFVPFMYLVLMDLSSDAFLSCTAGKASSFSLSCRAYTVMIFYFDRFCIWFIVYLGPVRIVVKTHKFCQRLSILSNSEQISVMLYENN